MGDSRHKVTYEKVCMDFIEKGYEVHTTKEDYHDAQQKLKIVCPDGHTIFKTYSSLRNGHGCRKCQYKTLSKKFSLSYEEVRLLFEKNGCTLLSKTYTNNGAPLKYKCKCGFIGYKTAADMKRGTLCKTCGHIKTGDTQRKTTEWARRVCKDNGMELIGKYYSNKEKIVVRCTCGSVYQTTIGVITQGCKCYKCGIKKLSGENSVHWKGGSINYKRVLNLIRRSPEYLEWREKVIKRDLYTCQNCNKVNSKLICHHLDSFTKHKEKRFDILNGITLCKKCHYWFHYDYGYINCYKEQFMEFMHNSNTKNEDDIEYNHLKKVKKHREYNQIS